MKLHNRKCLEEVLISWAQSINEEESTDNINQLLNAKNKDYAKHS